MEQQNKNDLDFDKKYKFSKADLDYLKFTKIDQNIASLQVTGKPSKLVVDIIKRFFSNIYSTIAFVIFLLLLIFGIIVVLTSQYSSVEPISKVSDIYVKEQVPSFYGNVKMTYSTTDLENIFEKNRDLIKGAPEWVGPDRWKVCVNPYEIITELSGEGSKPIKALMGTDSFGRDIWLRTWAGTLHAVGIAFIITSMELIIGIAIGSYLGFHVGKWIDTVLLRIIEIFDSIPWIVLFIILIGIFEYSTLSLVLIMVLTGWTSVAYNTRRFTILVKDEEYIYAARAIGASKIRIIFSHVLPSIAGKLANNFVLRITSSILGIASIAFLGFIKEEVNATPNLGLIITSSRSLVFQNPWALAFPSLILLTLALSLRFIALGIHDSLDPKVRKKGK